jgi:hypothetical protein
MIGAAGARLLTKEARMSLSPLLAAALLHLHTATAGQAPPAPITDRAAYSVYAALLPGWKRSAEDPLVVQRETQRENREACGALLDSLTGEWAEAASNLRNAGDRLLQEAMLPDGGAGYRLVSRAEILAHDAPLLADTSQPFPRPGVLEHIAVSAVGLNAAKNKALVYLWRRLVSERSHGLAMMEFKDGKWVSGPRSCGGSDGH